MIKVLRMKGTYLIINGNNNFLIQFSLKQPWLLPKHDPNYMNGQVDLYGWLFFYFGRFKNLDKDIR